MSVSVPIVRGARPDDRRRQSVSMSGLPAAGLVMGGAVSAFRLRLAFTMMIVCAGSAFCLSEKMSSVLSGMTPRAVATQDAVLFSLGGA